MIEVRAVDGRRPLRQFIGYPYTKYRLHPHWTPHLRLSERRQFDSARNPYFRNADVQLFIALDGRRVAGRIAAFDTDPFVMLPCNPPEYAGYLEGAGYAKVMDLYAWLFDLRKPLPERIGSLVRQSQQRERFEVRPADFSDFPREMEKLRAVYSRARETNWGFVPPTPEGFQHMAADLKQIAIPDGVLLAYSNGTVVGCAVGVPDINQAMKGRGGRLLPLGLWRFLRRNRIMTRARLLLFGVTPEYRDTEVLVLLLHGIHAFVTGAGYTSTELSWKLESNAAVNRSLEQGGATRYKTYRLYQKAVG